MNKISLVILFVAQTYSFTSMAGEFDFSAYKKTTLSAMLDEQQNDICVDTKGNESIFSAVPIKYHFTVKFTRELRELSQDNKVFLTNYSKSMPWSKSVIDLYKNEFLVEKNNTQYWVPVQEPLLTSMGSELEIGREFELYVAVIGAAKGQCIFITTEFNANAKDT